MTLIAILDDRATNRQIFSKLAASLEAGIQVEAFGDPLTALDWLDVNPPDLVVADYKMPQINGAEFTRRLRQSVHGKDVPLIIVTAYDDRDDKLRALEAGATDFLQTPVDHQEFISRARNLLDLRRHQQVAQQRTRWLEHALATSEAIRRELRPATPLTDPAPLAQILDLVPVAVSVADRGGNHLYVNARYAEQAGCRPADLVGRPAYAAAEPGRASRHLALDRLVLETATAIPRFEEVVTNAAGLTDIRLTTKAPLLDASGQVVSVLTCSVERPDAPPVRHDRLTGLPNLERLRADLGARLAAGAPTLALLVIGLDGFSAVNDTKGQAAGDELLRAVALRLRQLGRPEDFLARGRGDEFAILQAQAPDEMAAVALADRLRRAIELPFEIVGDRLSITASIGVALFPMHGTTPAELLRAGQRALREAKAHGRNLARLFEPGMTMLAPGPVQGDFLRDGEPRDRSPPAP